jgi:radical SAM protein with 4Fe4S-binding SPASM domain
MSLVPEDARQETLPSGPWVPRICVWELTLACDAACLHCGSSAGAARRRELDTSEGTRLIADLAQLGCESVTFSGGEPLLRSDWPLLARAVREQNMRVEMISNGLGVEKQAAAIVDAGLFAVTLSVDGPREVHDGLRGVPGALDRLLCGARALVRRGVRIAAVTQVNQRNLQELRTIRTLLVDAGFQGWQLQLTLPYGRAERRAHGLCLLPEQLPELEAEIVALRSQSDFFIQAADNIGYMSEREPLIRTAPGQPTQFWVGCGAGLDVIGITSDGTVRGCLALPAAADEGNVRHRSLASLWTDPSAFSYNRRFQVTDLQGPCVGCAFAVVCRGGCRALAWTTSPGSPHLNRYCSQRVESEPLPAA